MTLGYTLPGAKENILAGIKIHTLRQDRVNRWKPGYEIHHATGVRSAKYECFLKNKCRSVQQVLIIKLSGTSQPDILSITVDRRRLSRGEVNQIAINDGFTGEKGMMDWFFPPGQKVDMWAGKIIHWTKLKY